MDGSGSERFEPDFLRTERAFGLAFRFTGSRTRSWRSEPGSYLTLSSKGEPGLDRLDDGVENTLATRLPVVDDAARTCPVPTAGKAYAEEDDCPQTHLFHGI